MSNNLKLTSEELEPYIISHSINDVSFFLKIKKYLDTNSSKGKSYFNDEKLQKIFNIISKWYDKYAKFPTQKELRIINDKLHKDDNELRFLISSAVEKIYETKPSDIDNEFIEEETINFIKENNVYEAMMQSQIDIQEQNYSAIADRMKEAIAVNFDKDLGFSIREIEKGLSSLTELNEEYTISSGFPTLDEVLDGGWRGKEIYTFAAVPGIGKCCHKDVKVMVSYEIDEDTGEII